MARQRTRLRTVAQRRKRVWARQDMTLSPVSPGRAQGDLGSEFSSEMGTTHLPVGSTIGGILLEWQSVQLIARASSTDHAVMGIICVDEATATETPSPVADPHADWMYRVLVPTGAAAGTTYSTFEAMGGPVRVKAQRKCEELGSHLWLIVETVGTTTYDFTVETSVLMLLP